MAAKAQPRGMKKPRRALADILPVLLRRGDAGSAPRRDKRGGEQLPPAALVEHPQRLVTRHLRRAAPGPLAVQCGRRPDRAAPATGLAGGGRPVSALRRSEAGAPGAAACLACAAAVAFSAASLSLAMARLWTASASTGSRSAASSRLLTAARKCSADPGLTASPRAAASCRWVVPRL